MSNWEYKVISSGKGGFATPALLEKFLNDLGRDEWEIVEFRTSPDNALAFTGLARRLTQRDWTLEDAAAAAAKQEAEKLRAEFEAKFKAATSASPSSEEKASSFLEEKAAPEDGFRKPIDTSRDSDPDAPDDEGEKDEWDQLAAEDELPSFFDALKPHMRRNQRGPGQSVGLDFLAKKWGLAEEDIKGALVECGLQIPADENAKPVYVEYDGDLYWVNINRRGEVWINTREKPRPVFRIVQGTKVAPESIEETKPERSERPERAERRENGEAKTEAVRQKTPVQTAGQAEMPAAPAGEGAEPRAETPGNGGGASQALPTGPELLGKIRPMMRRNRRGPGGSGSASFLSRALKCGEPDLLAAFATLGLTLPENGNDKPTFVEIGSQVWWLNKDSRGGIWINGRDKRDGDVAKSETAAPAAESAGAEKLVTESSVASEPVVTPPTPEPESARNPELPLDTAPANAPAAPSGSPLTAVRLLLKETKTGAVAAKLERVAEELGKSPDELLATLTAAGLKVPEKSREKPVFVEHGEEILWLNRNTKNELWINAKASKFAGDSDGESGGEKKSRRPRGKKKSDDASAAGDSPAGEAETTPAS
jgi:hypothetical protein